MDKNTKEKLMLRNNKIIAEVLNEINTKYPETVDLVAIAGSFASGLFYEKSDLDLLIIENDKSVENISNCFIYENIGYDIYISSWERLELMANYDNHFVTKLKDLIFIYTKDNNVMNRYEELQDKLNKNMNDTKTINKKIGKYLGDAINIQKTIIDDDNMNSCYKKLGLIMNIVETIIYMLNKKYVIGGTKYIPIEIKKMEVLPNSFLDNYYKLLNCNSKEDIYMSTNNILKIMEEYFNDNDIKIIFNQNKEKSEKIIKKNPTKNDLVGTYEELYSNYYNKLLHAASTNNKYLSFRTMMDIQNFFDELYEMFNIPYFSLIEKYNPNDLKNNVVEVESKLNEWLKIYKKFDIKVNIIDSLDEIYT